MQKISKKCLTRSNVNMYIYIMKNEQTPTGPKAQGANATKNNRPALNGKQNEIATPKEEKTAPRVDINATLSRLESLRQTAEHRTTTLNHLTKVQGLKCSELDEERDMLVLVDSKNTQYHIKSSFLLQKVQAMLIAELSAKVTEFEAQLVI